MALPVARPCHRCHEFKELERFPFGRSGRRRSSVCWACWEAEAYVRMARVEEWRATWTDPGSGRRVRRCSTCREVKDLLEGYYFSVRRIGRYAAACKPCHDKRTGAALKLGMTDVTQRERLLERRREASRRYRARHPERSRAAGKRWKARVKADPERWAQILEDARINYRLRAEREGRTVRGTDARMARATRQHERAVAHCLPTAPLVALIERLVEARQRAEGFPGEPSAAVIGRVCSGLGVSDRRFRQWRSGSALITYFDVAERVVLAGANGDWTVVYPPAEYPDVYTGLLEGVA